jgi:hypothetical protein
MGKTEYFDKRRSLMMEAYTTLGVLSKNELSIMRCIDHPDNIGKQNIYKHNLDSLKSAGSKILKYILQLHVLRN